MDSNLKNLIFGKSDLERIVNIEPKDSSAEVFLELPSGEITSQFVPNIYWLLADRPLDNSFNKLDGNLFFKYDKQYETREQFLEDKRRFKGKTFSIYEEREALMVIEGYTYYKGMKPEDVSILAFDIETTGLDPTHKDAKVLLISNTFRKQGTIVRRLFAFDEFESEAHMLTAWCNWVREINPSNMIGHNIFGFDLQYLFTRAKFADISLNLGRDGSAIRRGGYEKKFRVDGNRDIGYYDFRIYGREIIDTMQIAIKADVARRYDSYGLKAIIKHEKWEKPNRTFYDASKIRFNYTNPTEWSKIKEYCKDDGDDALTLYDKFIAPYFFMSQSIPKPFQLVMQSASGSQLNAILVRSYLQLGHSIPLAEQENKFEGAISFGNAGIYSNCMKVDVASLYPSLILQYKIFNKAKDPFGNLLTMVEYFTTERLKNKKLAQETGDIYYKHLEQSQKISINSIYGLLGAPGLAFNSLKDAAMVTMKGRQVLQQAVAWAKHKNFVVVNGDTDSITFCKSDQSFINSEERKEILEELNRLYPKYIKWADDGYYTKVIVIKAKNYVLLKEDGKIKYKGSALKSPKLEKALDEFIHKMVSMVLDGKMDYLSIYNHYVREIHAIEDIKRWANRYTISQKTLESDRTNEEKLRQAIEGSEYVEGDRFYAFFKSDDSLCLVEKFDGDYNKDRLLEKLYKTSLRFQSIMDAKTLFPNYKLKRNKKLLEDLLCQKN